MRVIRLITYEGSREVLDHHLSRSRPDGIDELTHHYVPYTLEVRTLLDERTVPNVFPGVELKENSVEG